MINKNKNKSILLIFDKLIFDLEAMINFVDEENFKVDSLNRKFYREYLLLLKAKKTEQEFFVKELKKTFKDVINFVDSDDEPKEFDKFFKSLKRKNSKIKFVFLNERIKLFLKAIKNIEREFNEFV